jgi:hypothetical protein
MPVYVTDFASVIFSGLSGLSGTTGGLSLLEQHENAGYPARAPSGLRQREAGRSTGSGLNTCVRRWYTTRMSADVGDALLGFRLVSGLGLRRKR